MPHQLARGQVGSYPLRQQWIHHLGPTHMKAHHWVAHVCLGKCRLYPRLIRRLARIGPVTYNHRVRLKSICISQLYLFARESREKRPC